MTYHALASPSKAEMWIACANSLAMNKGQPEGDKKAADLGTDKHELLTLCLEFGKNAADYDGHVLKMGHKVNKEFANDVQTVLDSVRERIRNYLLLGGNVGIELEQQLPIEHITGEAGATGTGDILLIVSWPDGHSTLDVVDAKFGWVEVEAEENPQLLMYASGALEKFGIVEDFDEVTLVIEQPAHGTKEWTVTPNEVDVWVNTVAGPAAEDALLAHKEGVREEWYNPTEKGCHWCKAKAVCPAALAKVEESVMLSFEEDMVTEQTLPETAAALPVEKLAEIFPQLEFIEDWINAVRARVEYHMLAGEKMPGLKLVVGKRGNRAWSSDEEAEAMMKQFKMKMTDMYSWKLKGPKPILELLEKQPRRMKQIEALIVQADGKPHVALESDKRPALEIKPVEDGFEAD